MLAKIFEMFQQADQTLDRAQGGLGIGLTLVKKLVELHGGSVEAHSDGPNRGSQFDVWLPAGAHVFGDATTRLPHHDADREVLGPHRILVVDDEPTVGNVVAMMLRSLGQQVTVVSQPTAVYALLCQQPTDAVFLDLAMPGISGYDLARRIRRTPEFAGLPLIALTGYGRDEDRRQSTESGFNFHLTKPASRADLAEVLAQVHWREPHGPYLASAGMGDMRPE